MPEIEERESARFCGYPWANWLELDMPERVDGIAHFRVQRLLDIHRQDAVAQESERRAMRARKH